MARCSLIIKNEHKFRLYYNYASPFLTACIMLIDCDNSDYSKHQQLIENWSARAQRTARRRWTHPFINQLKLYRAIN